MFVEMITNELRKHFNTYRNDGKFLKKVNYDEKLCLQLDRFFFNIYAEILAKPYESQHISEYLFDHNILLTPQATGVKDSLINLGIKGLLVCGCG